MQELAHAGVGPPAAPTASTSFAVPWRENGFVGLISVSPPDAELASSSKIAPEARGKCPARRLPNGRWVGYDWGKLEAGADDVRQWVRDGANIGLRADSYPMVDIDCTDADLAAEIERLAVKHLGAAPVRVGRAPKRLLLYRATEPFSRMRLWIQRGGVSHLVEILGQGQQAVMLGTHPATRRPYAWDRDVAALAPPDLTEITREQADAFLGELAGHIDPLSLGTTEREGDGRPIARTANADQTTLRAPSLDALREAVGLLPNTNEMFPDRTSYLKVGYAIRAAGGEDEDEAFALFASWAARWEGNDRQAGNDPEVVLSDWRRMRGPFSVGWTWLASQARPFGFNDAQHDFDAIEESVRELPRHIADFNRRFAFVESVANCVLHTPGDGSVEYWPVAHWHRMVENETIPVPANRGVRVEPISKHWSSHPARRDVVRITFDPRAPTLADVPSATRAGRNDFNAWPGFKVAASTAGSCELFKAHLRDIVCGGREDAYRWLTHWCAALVQDPARLPGTAIVLKGRQGTGKSKVGEVLGAILGPKLYVVVAGTEELTGRFNSRLEGKVLVQAEEAFFAGDKSARGRIKTLVTGPTLSIERKGIDAIDVPNLSHVLVTSNEKWVVPAELGERRFAVFNVSAAREKDRQYFRAMHDELFENGGLGRLRHFLEAEVTIDWDFIAEPIPTDALRDQQLQSLEPDQRWLYDLLEEGALPGDELGEGVAWTDVLYLKFEAFMRAQRWSQRTSPTMLGKAR